MRARRAPLLVTLAILAFASCGGDDGDTADPGSDAPDATVTPGDGAGTDRWQVTLEDDSTLVVTLDVAPDHPAVAPFEAYRQAVDAGPVTWVVGEITQPADTAGTGRYITFVADGMNPIDDDPSTPDDGISSAEFACSLLDRWTFAEDAPELTDDLNAQYEAMYTDTCGGSTFQVIAPAGATTTYVMAYLADSLPEFERVFAGLAFEMSPTG